MVTPDAESLPKGNIASTEKTLIHVLHVDDDAGYLKTAKKILEMHGSFQVETVLSVEEAMEKMEKKTFDVIVSDYIMPGKDGLEFLKELRDSGNSIPFIIFTGKGREIVAIKALNLGANQYINKIGKPEAVYGELAHGIRTVVKGKKAEEALRKSEEKYRELINGMNDTALVLNFDGKIIDVNNAAVMVLGYSREELLSMGPTDIDSALTPEQIKVLIKGMKTDELEVFQTLHTTKDGKTFPVEISSSRVTYHGKQAVLTIARDITERKRAEEKLRQSEERYRTVFENTGTAMCILEEDKTISMVNKRFEALSGYSWKELEGKKWTELVTKEYLERMKRYHKARRKKSGKPPTHYTFDFVNKKGQIRNAMLTINLIHGIKKSVASILDITEQKKLNDELRMSEQRFKDLVEATTDWIWETDKNGVYVYVNPKVKELLGYEVSEVLGKIPFDFMSKEEAKRVWKNFREQIINKESSFKLEKVSRHKDGHLVIVESSSIAIFDEKGQLTGYRGIDRNITERKRIEKQLKESEEKYHKQFEEALDAVFLADAETGILIDCNRAATKLFGRKKSELVGKHQRILHPSAEINGEFSRTFKQHLKEREGQVLEAQVITKSGEIRDVAIKANIFELGNKKIMQAEFRDITEQKKAEEALRKSEKSWSDSFNSLEDIMIIIDNGFTIEKMNDIGLKLLGKTREEVVGKKCYQLIHGLDAPGEFCPYEKMLKTGKLESVERYEKKFDKYFSIKSSPIFNERREILGFVDLMRDVTEQKKAEAALRESEEKYRELLNGMNDTAWVIDFDCNIIDVNDAAVEVMGYSREELLSMELTGIDSNLDPKEIKGLVEGMPAAEIQVFETVHTTKDGKTIPVEISSSLVTYRGKQAILSIARDITERKRAEKKLRQSEERHRAVFEHTGTAMCIIEEDKTISMVNRRLEELSGYSWKELEGKKWTDFVTKDSSLERMKRYHEARRKKGEKAPTNYPLDFVNKKGQIRNALLTINLIPETKKSVASILDITESKKTEKALRESEEKYRETIVNANVGIIGYGPEGEVKVLNPKMEQMTGFKRSEIPTLQDWFKKLYPNKEERYKIRDKWFKRMSEEGEVKEGHATITTKDGKRRNFLFNAVHLESGDSIAFALDITERKEAAKKLDEMMNELVTINEKLGVVGKLTRHDARNKLSVITNNAYLAKQKLAANHNSLEYLGDIESAVDQIEKIFDFATTYEMLGIEELSYMNVEKNVNEAAILFSGLAGAKLVNDCQGLTVMADSLLRQLFYNLIDDTLKHGEKVSQIRVYYEEGEYQLKLIYEDDGVGIPNDEKEKIFKEGYGKGTGYGLYLIKKMCKAYGWTIRETGKPEKGAQFTITIPKMNANGKIAYRLH